MGFLSRLFVPRRPPLGLKGKNTLTAKTLRVRHVGDSDVARADGRAHLVIDRGSGDISLETDSGPVLEQGATYSCVANAIADAEKTTLKACYGIDAELGSRRVIYYMARRFHENPVVDDGTFIDLACDAIARFGILPEKYFPFSSWSIDEKPPIDVIIGAYGRRGIRGYYAIDDDGDALIEKIVSVLHSRRALVFGSLVDDTFVNAHDRSVIPWPYPGRILGGHALEIVGAQTVAGSWQFRVKSSWGSGWADSGYAWLEAGWILNGHSFEVIDPKEP